MNIRRTIGFLASVILVWVARGIWDWTPELRERLGDSPWQSVGLLTLTVLAIVFLIWALYDPDSWKVLMTFLLGIGTALWGRDLLKGIEWSQTMTLLGAIFGLVLLWFITTWDEIFGT